MNLSKEILLKAGIVPKLKLLRKNEGEAPVSTGPHRVKILEEKLLNGKDELGNAIHIMRYYFEEEGEKKQYDVPVKDKKGDVHYLIQHLSEVEPGEEIQLTAKKKGIKNYIEVLRFKDSSHAEVDEEQIISLDNEENHG